MSTDLHTQIHDYAGYFGSTLPDIDLESLLTQPVAPRQLPRLKPLEPRRPRWAVALAAGVVVLLLVGGIAWLAGLFGGTTQPVIDSPPPSVTTQPTTTTIPTPTTATSLAAKDPVISEPLRGRIAFTSDRDCPGFPGLFVMNVDGSEVESLIECDVIGPAWSPDGSRIAFGYSADLPRVQVWVANSDGTGLDQLTNEPGGAHSPRWSPDGTRLAFQTESGAGIERIDVINADGSGQAEIASSARSPAWSPDGSRIAFTRLIQDELGNTVPQDLYVVNVDGTGLLQLTDSPESEHSPAWSPDGTRLVFVTDVLINQGDIQSLLDSQVFLISSDGTELTQLTTEPGEKRNPTWSPDGSHISLVTMDGFHLVVVNVNDRSIRQLTDLVVQPPFAPSWYLDSTHIIFSGGADFEAHADLYVVNVDGTGLRQLTDSPESDGSPAWAPFQ